VRSRIIARHIGGQSNREIAKEEGIDRDTVSRVLSQGEVVELMKSYRSRLLEMLPKAITVYKQLLSSKDERVRAAAATKLLEGLQVFPKGGVWPEQTVPEQDHDNRKRLLLGQIVEMMIYKGQRYGIALPKEFDELKSAGIELDDPQPLGRSGSRLEACYSP